MVALSLFIGVTVMKTAGPPILCPSFSIPPNVFCKGNGENDSTRTRTHSPSAISLDHSCLDRMQTASDSLEQRVPVEHTLKISTSQNRVSWPGGNPQDISVRNEFRTHFGSDQIRWEDDGMLDSREDHDGRNPLGGMDRSVQAVWEVWCGMSRRS